MEKERSNGTHYLTRMLMCILRMSVVKKEIE